MFPGLHPMAMMSTVSMGGGPAPGGGGGMGRGGDSRGMMSYGGGGNYMGGGGPGGSAMYGPQSGPGAYPPSYNAPYPGGNSSQYADNFEETAHLYIPNYSVGAIIGTKGSHIRNIIRFSGASIKIGSQESSPPEGLTMPDVPERIVTIIGTPEAQWKVRTFCS